MRYSSFALQVFLPMETAQDLRGRLHAMIRASPSDASFTDKWAFYRSVGLELASRAQGFEYGVWDYVEEHERAEAEFDKWCRGTVADTQEAAQQGAAVPVYRQSSGPRLMFATLLFLMRKGGASDRYVCEVCRIPEATWWLRSTFAAMLRSVAGLNFESVRADAVYVRPGSDGGGVTREELTEEQYRYLKRLG